MKILVVEDDPTTRDYIVSGLEQESYAVEIADDGLSALSLAQGSNFNAIILDRMIPDKDGLGVLRALRHAGDQTPIILLTAIGGLDDRVEGLDAGADDYLVKPFSYIELSARLSAILRRPKQISEVTKLKVSDLEMDLVRRSVTREGKPIDLLQKEFALLEYFMRAEGQVISKSMLLEHIWGFRFDPQTSVVETHISRLRSKIDRPFAKPLLQTIKNVGYTIRG